MTSLSRFLLLASALGTLAATSACTKECRAYNDCPTGQFCSNEFVCLDHVAIPGQRCSAGGASDYFLSRGRLGQATHFLCDLPTPNDLELPQFVDVVGNTALVSGGSTTLELYWNIDEVGSSATDGLFIYFGIPNTDQMFAFPAEDAYVGGALPNPFAFDVFTSQSLGGNFPVSVGFASHYPDIDPEQTELLVGPRFDVQFDVINVQGGDIQLSISWDTEVDIDLHVLSPLGEHVYYGNPNVESGGGLDLDANAGCSDGREHNENIFWPDDSAPSGTYKVWVDYFSNCAEGGESNFRVTKVIRREDYEIYEESFIASDVTNDPYDDSNPLFQFSF